jgi:hypothetical protein
LTEEQYEAAKKKLADAKLKDKEFTLKRYGATASLQSNMVTAKYSDGDHGYFLPFPGVVDHRKLDQLLSNPLQERLMKGLNGKF